VEIVYLVDANVFLEILLGQAKKGNCKRFLDDNAKDLNISDFSLHSIGVILFKYNKEDIFQKFIQDVAPKIGLLSLPIDFYEEVISAKKTQSLDFDDAYQYRTAEYHGLRVVTMDRDFEGTGDDSILYL
jgi:predicted nucleic acid-binding protein